MAIWLFKTEPGDYSYADLERDGKTVWDGVGNNWALKNLRELSRPLAIGTGVADEDVAHGFRLEGL